MARPVKDNQVYDLHQDDEYAGVHDGVHRKGGARDVCQPHHQQHGRSHAVEQHMGWIAAAQRAGCHHHARYAERAADRGTGYVTGGRFSDLTANSGGTTTNIVMM